MSGKYITVEGICEEFNLCTRTVYNMMRGEYRKNGKLHRYREPFPDPCGKSGRMYYFLLEDVRRYFKTCGQYRMVNGVLKRR